MKVRVIYNDDGSEGITYDGKVLHVADIKQSIGEVADALKAEGFTVGVSALRRVSLDDFINELLNGKDDMVFNLCEGAFEKSYLEMNVAALLELYDVPFTGNSALTLGVALNKGWTKEILKGNGISTANYIIKETTKFRIPDNLNFPLIVKPLKEDASIGIDEHSVVRTMDELKIRVDMIIKKYNQPALIEEYIDGREFNVSVMGSGKDIRVLPPSEIDFSNYPQELPKICSFEAKWVEHSPLYLNSPPICPALVSDFLKEELKTIAIEAYNALNCRDYARVDMRLGADDKLRVLEVNPNPDISKGAGFARAAGADGFLYHEMLGEIVSLARKRYGKK